MDTTLIIQLVVAALIVLMLAAAGSARSRTSRWSEKSRRMGASTLVAMSALFSSEVVDPAKQAKVEMVREYDGEGEDPEKPK